MNALASSAAWRHRISGLGIASCVLIVAGLVLGAVWDMAWMILFGAGAFGPSLLRASGLLNDRDEFEQDAARRAGQHAYLAGGVFLCAVVVVRTWGTRTFGGDAFSASTVLAVMVITYLMSRLVGFWGPEGAAFRVLLVFGLFWLAFVVLSHPGLAMLPELLVALPFFVLAFTSRRWPRSSGVVLLLLAAFAFFFFRLQRALGGDQGAWMVIVALVAPLLAMGVGLIAARRERIDRAATGS